jgi:hypothetical protein
VDIIQEQDQHQLRIRYRIDPQFDPFTQFAEFDQAEPLPAEYAATTPVEKMQPIRDRGILFRCARREQRRKLGIRRQRPPNKLEAKRNHDIGKTRLFESTRARAFRRQDQARRVRLRTPTASRIPGHDGSKTPGQKPTQKMASRNNGGR